MGSPDIGCQPRPLPRYGDPSHWGLGRCRRGIATAEGGWLAGKRVTNTGGRCRGDEATGLLYLEAYVSDPADVLSDTLTVTALGRAPVVPAILRGNLLCKALATFVTEKLTVAAVVLVKRKFEFGAKCPFAVSTCMRHASMFSRFV